MTPTSKVSRAIELDQADQLKALLAAGLSPNALVGLHPMAIEGTLLEFAAQKNARKAAALLIEAGAKTNEGKLKPLIVAVAGNHVEIARVLLDAGADPNVARNVTGPEGDRGVTALMFAAVPPPRPELLDLLLARGADPHALTKKGSSALSRAIDYDNAPAAIRLLQAGCKPDGALLLRPIYRGQLELLRAFIAAGADLNVRGIWSKQKSRKHWEDAPVDCTPLDAAVSQRTEFIQLLRNLLPAERARFEPRYKSQADLYLTMIQDLIRGGADVNKIALNVPPLYWAADSGDFETVKLLLEAGANPNLVQKSPGNTPLHRACCGGFVEIVECLLKAGANIKITNEQGRTALDALRQADKPQEIVLWEQTVQQSANPEPGMMEAKYEAWNQNRAKLIQLLESRA